MSKFWLVSAIGLMLGSPGLADFQKAKRNSDFGYRLVSQKKYAEAVNYFAVALKQDSEYWQAWQGLGNAYFFLGHKGKALDAYFKALELNPDNPTLKKFVLRLTPPKKSQE